MSNCAFELAIVPHIWFCLLFDVIILFIKYDVVISQVQSLLKLVMRASACANKLSQHCHSRQFEQGQNFVHKLLHDA